MAWLVRRFVMVIEKILHEVKGGGESEERSDLNEVLVRKIYYLD